MRGVNDDLVEFNDEPSVCQSRFRDVVNSSERVAVQLTISFRDEDMEGVGTEQLLEVAYGSFKVGWFEPLGRDLPMHLLDNSIELGETPFVSRCGESDDHPLIVGVPVAAAQKMSLALLSKHVTSQVTI